VESFPDIREADAAAPGSNDPALRQSLNRLRFAAPLEAEFRQHYEAASVGTRLLLCLMAVLAVALTPVYDALLLHPPAGFVPFSRWVQFGLEIPAILLGVLCALPPLRRLQAAAIIVGCVVTVGGFTAQRVVGGTEHGYHFPLVFVATAIAAVYVMGRLRFAVFTPWAVALTVAAAGIELHTFQGSSASYYNVIALVILLTMLAAGGYVLERTARENWYWQRQLGRMALNDPLTSLPNRRHFDAAFTRLLRAAARERQSVALLLLDVDDFKSYNDHHGHPAGDVCLQRIAHWLQSQMRRPQDFAARIGGEEFVAVWYGAKPEDARRLAEALRVGIKSLAIPHRGRSIGGLVTASGGFVEVMAPEPEEAARSIGKALLREADALLYRAKDTGRDRLVLATAAEAAPADDDRR